MTEKPTNNVGNMHGLWMLLLKVSLALMPLAFLWAAWITSEVYASRHFRLLGDRFTDLDFEVARREMEREQQIKMLQDRNRWEVAVARLDAVIDALPPVDWQDRIRVLEKNQDDLKSINSDTKGIQLEILKLLKELHGETKP